MLHVWEQDYELPSYKELSKVRTQDLSPTMRDLLSASSRDDRYAAKKMVAYVALTRGIAPDNVTVDHLIQPDVAQAAWLYRPQFKNISAYFQHFLECIGESRTLPLQNRKYKGYHPQLLEWLEVKSRTVRNTEFHQGAGMRFLKWITTDYYRGYDPHTFPVELLDRDALLHFRQNLLKNGKRQNLRNSYLHANMAAVCAWVRWLIAEQRVSDIPLHRLAISAGTNRLRNLPTDQQIETLIETAIRINRPDFALVMLIILSTGGRPSEICQLRFSGINTDTRRITLCSKGGPAREIRLDDELWDRLMDYVQSTFGEWPSDEAQQVFLNQSGTPLNYGALKHCLYRIERLTGIELDGFMALRHKFATDCLEAGVPTRVFLYLMGQKGVSEKGRYQHVQKDFQYKEIQRAFASMAWKDELNVKP